MATKLDGGGGGGKALVAGFLKESLFCGFPNLMSKIISLTHFLLSLNVVSFKSSSSSVLMWTCGLWTMVDVDCPCGLDTWTGGCWSVADVDCPCGLDTCTGGCSPVADGPTLPGPQASGLVPGISAV